MATTLSVTSATSASAGSYPVKISATSGSYGASASGSYTVTGSTTPPASCTRAAPALTLGTTSTAVGYGTPVSFSVKVANKDSSGCAATSFNLASGLPTDFTGSFAASRLSVAPGGSASTTITHGLAVLHLGRARRLHLRGHRERQRLQHHGQVELQGGRAGHHAVAATSRRTRAARR